MGSPAALLKKLKAFNVDQAIDNAIEEHTADYLVLQKDQLLRGLNSSGGNIKPQYADPYYARKKNRMNSLPGLNNPDLKLTGARNEAMTVKLEGKEALKLDSDVEYNKYLEEQYGPGQIWSLTHENMGVFRREVRGSMQTIITNETGLV